MKDRKNAASEFNCKQDANRQKESHRVADHAERSIRLHRLQIGSRLEENRPKAAQRKASRESYLQNRRGKPIAK